MFSSVGLVQVLVQTSLLSASLNDDSSSLCLDSSRLVLMGRLRVEHEKDFDE